MQNVCHTSPTEQIIQKSHRIQSGSLIPSKRTRLVRTELKTQYNNKDPHVETCFLHDTSDLEGVNNVKFQTQPSPLTLRAQNNTEDSSSWVPQFSSMKIDDPLEFSSEYKRLYSNYESRQRQNSIRQNLPFRSSMVRKTTLNYPLQNTLQQQRQGNRNDPTDAFNLSLIHI